MLVTAFRRRHENHYDEDDSTDRYDNDDCDDDNNENGDSFISKKGVHSMLGKVFVVQALIEIHDKY